jgi:hypothetical protein
MSLRVTSSEMPLYKFAVYSRTIIIKLISFILHKKKKYCSTETCVSLGTFLCKQKQTFVEIISAPSYLNIKYLVMNLFFFSRNKG